MQDRFPPRSPRFTAAEIEIAVSPPFTYAALVAYAAPGETIRLLPAG